MKLRKVLTVSAVVLAGLAALLYVNRLYLLKYSLGWYTDILYPREANHPVPWLAGPDQADQPLAQRPPNIIAPGTQYQQPISNIDILPTVVAAAGGTLPTDRVIDGVNLLPFLGAKPATQASCPLFWRDGIYHKTLDQPHLPADEYTYWNN